MPHPDPPPPSICTNLDLATVAKWGTYAGYHQYGTGSLSHWTNNGTEQVHPCVAAHEYYHQTEDVDLDPGTFLADHGYPSPGVDEPVIVIFERPAGYESANAIRITLPGSALVPQTVSLDPGCTKCKVAFKIPATVSTPVIEWVVTMTR